MPFQTLFRQKSLIIFLSLFSVSTRQLKADESHSTHFQLKQITDLEVKSFGISPELKIVRNFRSQKEAEVFSRTSDFLPHAFLNFKRTKDFYEERNDRLKAFGIQTYDSSWGIDYNWNVFNYGLLQAARKSYAEKEKSHLDVSNQEKAYPINFKTYLLKYLLAKYKKVAVENSLKKAESQKKEASLGFALGQKTKIDVLRSEANMVSLDSKKTVYFDEEQNAKSKFLEYSGLDIRDTHFLDSIDENQTIGLINALSFSDFKKAEPDFTKSPLMHSLQYDEKINSLALSSLTQREWPDLKIQGSYNNSADSFNESFHKPYRTHSIALVLTIPILNGGSLFSSNFEEFFAKKQNEYIINQKKLETKNQLNSTLIKISALETLMSSLSLNVSQFEELYRLTLKSYQLGRSTLFELLEVQDNLLLSKISLAENKIQFYTLSQNYLWQAGLL